MSFIAWVVAIVLYLIVGAGWLAWRLGDKGFGRNPLLVRVLDWLLITPLLPFAYLIGRFTR